MGDGISVASFLVGFLAFLTSIVLSAGLIRVSGQQLSMVLSRREWVILVKLIAIGVMSTLLYLFENALQLSPEMFLYGRF